MFFVVKATITNRSKTANSLQTFRLTIEGEPESISPAIYGTTADGSSWFLRSRDERMTAYFPMLSPANIPLSPVNVAPGHAVDFDMPFAHYTSDVRHAMSATMQVHVGAGLGPEVIINVPPIQDGHLTRLREDGTHPIELYGPDGSRVSFKEVMTWGDFEVSAREWRRED
jgi:hypothetical protein